MSHCSYGEYVSCIPSPLSQPGKSGGNRHCPAETFYWQPSPAGHNNYILCVDGATTQLLARIYAQSINSYTLASYVHKIVSASTLQS